MNPYNMQLQENSLGPNTIELYNHSLFNEIPEGNLKCYHPQAYPFQDSINQYNIDNQILPSQNEVNREYAKINQCQSTIYLKNDFPESYKDVYNDQFKEIFQDPFIEGYKEPFKDQRKASFQDTIQDQLKNVPRLKKKNLKLPDPPLENEIKPLNDKDSLPLHLTFPLLNPGNRIIEGVTRNISLKFPRHELNDNIPDYYNSELNDIHQGGSKHTISSSQPNRIKFESNINKRINPENMILTKSINENYYFNNLRNAHNDFYRNSYNRIEYVDGSDTEINKRKIDRKAKIARYLEKKKRRNFKKKISYKVRKTAADKRIRFKGKFVSKKDEEFMINLGLNNKKQNINNS